MVANLRPGEPYLVDVFSHAWGLRLCFYRLRYLRISVDTHTEDTRLRVGVDLLDRDAKTEANCVQFEAHVA